jgi:hypothetical protein
MNLWLASTLAECRRRDIRGEARLAHWLANST